MIGTNPNPGFQGTGVLGAQMAGAQPGYGGLQGILDFLNKGGISGQSYANLGSGATGRAGMGAVGSGAGQLFAGLSPWAAQWMQQTLMQKNMAPQASLFAPDTVGASTTDPTTGVVTPGATTKGAALTGHDLLMANLHNSLANLAPATYGIASADASGAPGGGLSMQDLMSTISGMGNQVAGHNFYAHGYDANGKIVSGSGVVQHPQFQHYNMAHPHDTITLKQWTHGMHSS